MSDKKESINSKIVKHGDVRSEYWETLNKVIYVIFTVKGNRVTCRRWCPGYSSKWKKSTYISMKSKALIRRIESSMFLFNINDE